MSTIEVVPDALERSTLERLRHAGGVVQTTFLLPAEPWDLAASGITCIAGVDGPTAAGAALAVALRGADLVVVVNPAFAWPGLDDFLDDLQRLRATALPSAAGARSVAGRSVGSTAPSAAVDLGELSADQRQILALLADGLALPDVAARLYLSLRTAERRLGAARRLLGVRSTAEALVAIAGSDR